MRKSIQQRVDINFNEWMKDISLERVKQGLEKEIIPAREVTRMMMNTENITALEKELLTKQRKKNE
jgi:hypothetical protein